MSLEAIYTTGYGNRWHKLKGRTIPGLAKRYAELCRQWPDIRTRQKSDKPDSKGRFRFVKSIARVVKAGTRDIVGWIRPDGTYSIGATYSRKNPCNPICNPSRSRGEPGYQPCACRDCMDNAISADGRPALCHECHSAGCSKKGDRECERSDAYGVENPLRHFPSLKGRGRPASKRKFDMVTRLANGDIYQKTFTDTVRNAQARARRRMLTPHKGVKVAEVILDDGR